MKIHLRQDLFKVIFLLVFCFSGLLSIISIISGQFNYRNGITVSLLILPLVLLGGLKLDKVTLWHVVLSVVILLSGLVNKSTFQQTLFFLRNVIFSYLIYNLVQLCVRQENIRQILKWCVLVALVQLPIILIQKAIYPYLPTAVHQRIYSIDIGAGSFDINNDAGMTFFLVLIIIFLLFDNERNYFIKKKWLILPWLTLTIFIAEAEMLKLIVLMVWGIYLLVRFRSKQIFYGLLILIILVGTLASIGVFNKPIESMLKTIKGSLSVSEGATEKFLSGSYARGAAINYYLTRGISLLGDGPSKYLDIYTREKFVGNNGHLLAFYSEVGLLGWLSSVAIFFVASFPKRSKNNRVYWSNLLTFISLMLITITSFVMDNTAILLIFNIMSMIYLVPENTKPMQQQSVSEERLPGIDAMGISE